MSILLGTDPGTDPGIETAATPAHAPGVAAASVGRQPARAGRGQRRDRARLGRRGRLDRAPHRHPLAAGGRGRASAWTSTPSLAARRALASGRHRPRRRRSGDRRHHHRRRGDARRRTAGRARARRHPRRGVRRRLGLHRLSLGAGRRRRPRSRPGAPAASWSSAPTSCRGSPIPTTGPTAAVFADGAGAVVLERTDETSRIGPVILGADGAGADHIRVARDDGMIRMRGHETFREAVARLTPVHAAGRQGRRRRARRHRPVRLPPGQRPDPVRRRRAARAARPTASSTASPSTATPRRRRCRWRWPSASARAGCAPGDRVLLGAFGAGFTWGATVIEWGRP